MFYRNGFFSEKISVAIRIRSKRNEVYIGMRKVWVVYD